jgi:2,5-furandicarboxylate decarboxylase 1
MGLDATKSLSAAEMVFKRIRVPGEDQVDLDRVVAGDGRDWCKSL